MLAANAMRHIISEIDDLITMGRGSEAIFTLESFTAELLDSLALAYTNVLNDPEKAERAYRKAIQVCPGHWPLYTNLTHVLSCQDKLNEALHYGVKTIDCLPQPVAEPWYNVGVILTDLGRHSDAAHYLRQATTINPDHHNAAYNLSLVLLHLGQWEEGWKWYESRFKVNHILQAYYSRFDQHWDGKKHKNKSVCVFSEQGMGDFVMFSRLIPQLKKYFKTTKVEVQEPLVDTIDTKKLKIDEIISRPNTTSLPPVPDADYFVSVNSLPLQLKIFHEEQVPNEPYLTWPKRKHRGFSKKFVNVGLCWAGNGHHKKDYIRSVPLSLFRPLAELPNVKLFSLQKDKPGLRKWDNQWIDLNDDGLPMVDLSPEMKTIGDLANLISHMDLVITIDTSVAHVAGAMGKPVWMLVSFRGEWRWMRGERTCWYPSMRIFRQPTYGDWKTVIAEVTRQLSSWQIAQD